MYILLALWQNWFDSLIFYFVLKEMNSAIKTQNKYLSTPKRCNHTVVERLEPRSTYWARVTGRQRQWQDTDSVDKRPGQEHEGIFSSRSPCNSFISSTMLNSLPHLLVRGSSYRLHPPCLQIPFIIFQSCQMNFSTLLSHTCIPNSVVWSRLLCPPKAWASLYCTAHLH